jgi:hypothetical protein
VATNLVKDSVDVMTTREGFKGNHLTEAFFLLFNLLHDLRAVTIILLEFSKIS